MKKVKIKERFENAVDAFFENGEPSENSQFVLNTNSSALLYNEPETANVEKTASIIDFVKLVFLFLPGAFFLYKLTLTFVYVTFQRIAIRSDLGGWDYHFLMFFLQDFFLGVFSLLIGCFMTFIGVGSLRETKNLVVPGSIISFSLLLAGLFSFLPTLLRGEVIMYYSIYLFPLALAVAGFVKYWVNKNEEDSNQ